MSGTPPPSAPTDIDEERRSTRKRRAILEAATKAFLRNGYLGTSMDEIAALAGVSKQTVYTHFADKQRLFTELVLANTERVDDLVHDLTDLLREPDDLARDLGELARRYVTSVVQPEVLQLRRLVIGEAGRFPDLARTYYERVPEVMVAELASSLGHLAERGQLRLDDPQVAARHFVALILWIPLDRAMFVADGDGPTPADLERL